MKVEDSYQIGGKGIPGVHNLPNGLGKQVDKSMYNHVRAQGDIGDRRAIEYPFLRDPSLGQGQNLRTGSEVNQLADDYLQATKPVGRG